MLEPGIKMLAAIGFPSLNHQIQDDDGRCRDQNGCEDMDDPQKSGGCFPSTHDRPGGNQGYNREPGAYGKGDQ